MLDGFKLSRVIKRVVRALSAASPIWISESEEHARIPSSSPKERRGLERLPTYDVVEKQAPIFIHSVMHRLFHQTLLILF